MNARISSQAVKRCCFFLAIVLVCSSTPMLWAQTRHEKIVFSTPSRRIAAIDLYVKDRGFSRDEGLDVDIVRIRDNAAVGATTWLEHSLGGWSAARSPQGAHREPQKTCSGS